MHNAMKVYYIAGKYRAKDNNGVFEHIMHARRHARKWWLAGNAVICPHANTMFMDGPDGTTDELFLEGDKEILKRCDGIVMIDGWQESEGAKAELALARELGLEVIYDEHI